MDPNQLDYLVPYKQFYEYTKRTSNRRIDDEDIQKRYSHYKEKFAARQLSQFFSANKDKQWFLEKYHPTHSRARYEEMIQRRKKYMQEFLAALEQGEFDDVCFDKKPESSTAGEQTTDEEEEYESRLVIKTVPPTIAREKILEVSHGADRLVHFTYLCIDVQQSGRI